MDVKFRNLLPHEVEARLGRETANGVEVMLYKDARCDQRLLDESVGNMNWQKRYANGNANCIVSIWDADKGSWVEKEDVGSGSGPDAKKATASDSFKRACVAWGIGRELYTVPRLLVPAAVLKNLRVEKDNLVCCDNTLRVTTLDCTDDHIATDVMVEVLDGETVVHTIAYKKNAPLVTTGRAKTSTEMSNTSLTPPPGAEISAADLAVMYAKASIAGTSEAGINDWIFKKFGLKDATLLTKSQYKTVCDCLDKQAAQKKSA